MDNLNNASQKQLRAFIESVEKLESEKKDIADAVTAKYAEAKSVGFDVSAMKKVVKLRKLTKAEREEQDAILYTYSRAVGLMGTELGEWADKQEATSNVVRL